MIPVEELLVSVGDAWLERTLAAYVVENGPLVSLYWIFDDMEWLDSEAIVALARLARDGIINGNVEEILAEEWNTYVSPTRALLLQAKEVGWVA